MANPTDQLRAYINSQRTARDLVLKGANLRQSQLSGLRADGLNLEEADLRESNLTAVKWTGCILREARLDGADFSGAVLRMCDFDEARLTNAILVRTSLENSTARGARFDTAEMAEAVLTDTDFSRASLRGANLTGVSASGVDLRGADLRGAKLRDAVLVDADLRGADLTDADLVGADLKGADLRGVVGTAPALQTEESRWGEMPPEMKALTETMTPIVLETLHTAGQRGFIDPETAQRIIEDAANHQTSSPRSMPNPDTMAAVSQVLGNLGDNILPTLLSALQHSGQGEPPAEVKAMILKLREALGLDESASMDDILDHLTRGFGG